MKSIPYWLDTAPAIRCAETGGLPARCETAVIGGGFTGLSAALAMAREGIDVVVLEAGHVAGAASGRNGGHCNNGLVRQVAAVADAFGLERARTFYRTFDRAVETVERVIVREGIDCDFRRSGKIQLAAKPSHFDSLTRTHALLASGIDPQTSLVGPGDLSREIGSARFHGGLVYHRSAMLHPGRLGSGLARAAHRHGARIWECTGVTRWRRSGRGSHEFETAAGTLEAERVLVATGAGTGPAFPHLHRRILAVGSFIIATEPLAQSLVDAIMPTRRTAVTTKHIGHYFRMAPDNRLIFGGRARFARSDPGSDMKSGRLLARSMKQIFPVLGDVRVDYCWGGMLDMTMDRLPRAGVIDGCHHAMGYSGHGVQMSVHMGEVMAKVMAGDVEANPWRDLTWPALPGHAARSALLPLAGAWFRLLDIVS